MVSHDRLAAGFHGGSPAPTGPRIAASGEVALRISGKPDDALGCAGGGRWRKNDADRRRERPSCANSRPCSGGPEPIVRCDRLVSIGQNIADSDRVPLAS